MATKREVNSNLKYFTIAPNGKLGIYHKEPSELTVELETKTGKKKNYEIFDSIDGKIEALYTFQDIINFNGIEETIDKLAIRLRNETQIEILTCELSLSQSFITRLENLDFEKDVVIKAFKSKNDNGKLIQYVIPYQDGKKIETDYKKDGKKRLPMGIKNTVGKKVVWDFSEYTEALITIVSNYEIKSLYQDEKNS